MLDILSVVRVGDMHLAVLPLDNSGVAIFFGRAVFQHGYVVPSQPVHRLGHPQLAPAVVPVLARQSGVVDKQLRAVFERYGIGAGVGVEQLGLR